MEIQKNLTTTNFKSSSSKENKYIVIHYTSNNGDTAYNNTVYFKSEYRGASAHYFVDKTSIWQCVLDKDIAWHCGTTGTYYHKTCRNLNSIGVEMCSVKVNGVFAIPAETVNNTIWLVKQLMAKYNIPITNVIRHYDVTHKMCPEPFVRDVAQWESFKNRLVEQPEPTPVEPVVPKHWCEDIKNTLLTKGIITDDAQWSEYDAYVTKGLFMAIVDKSTGGVWPGEDDSIKEHWAKVNLISLCGKHVITDKTQWQDYDSLVSKALALAIIDNSTNNLSGNVGMVDEYKGKTYDHWGRAHLNSLCDKGIIDTVDAWVDHWDEPLIKSECMALIYKAFFK